MAQSRFESGFSRKAIALAARPLRGEELATRSPGVNSQPGRLQVRRCRLAALPLAGHGGRVMPRTRLGIFALLLAAMAVQAVGGLDAWHWRNPRPQGNPLLGVAAGPAGFVAAGDRGTLLFSTNARDWTAMSVATSGRFQGVTHHDGLFVAVGPGAWISADGTNWMQHDDRFLRAVTWADGAFLAAGWDGALLRSTNGLDWHALVSGTTHPLNGVAHAAGITVVAGGYFTNSALLTSSNGVDWTNRATGTDILNGVAHGNGLFVVVGQNFYGNTGVSLTSADGITWSRHVLGPAIYSAYGIVFAHGLFILAGSDGLFTSPDGVNWTRRYAEFPNSLYALASHAGQTLAVGNAGAVVLSSNGLDWARQTSGTWYSLHDLTLGAGTLVAVGGRGAVLSAKDGGAWTTHLLSSNATLTGVAYGLGRFIAVGTLYNGFNAPPQFFISTNGIDWITQAASVPLRDVIFTQGAFVAVGGTTSAVIRTSTNGLDWVPRAVTAPPLSGVAHGDGRLVAVGNPGAIVMSVDGGITWSNQNSGTTEGLSAVAWGGGRFVTGDSYGNVLTSTNGQDWSSQALGFGVAVNGVTYGEGTFVAVGFGNIITSTNGLNWTTRLVPSADRLNAVLYTGRSFVAVGEWGLALESGHYGPPSFTAPVRETNGVAFSIAGESGRSYRIQVAPQLTSPPAWSDWLTYTQGTNPARFLDNATLSNRLYRVISP